MFTSLNITTSLPAVRVYISQLYHFSTCYTCSRLSTTTPRLFLLYLFTSLSKPTSLPAVLVHISQLHHASFCFTYTHLSATPRLLLLYVYTSLNNTTTLRVCKPVHLCSNDFSRQPPATTTMASPSLFFRLKIFVFSYISCRGNLKIPSYK